MIHRKSKICNAILFIQMFFLCCSLTWAKSGIIVFQSDFGIKDGAVSEVKGVMYTVSPSLVISDLTHEIPAYNIWEASYRLYQTAAYWPKDTVFVSVVDPGVGTKRRSIVAQTKNGQYFVTPDNGTLTLVDDEFGIQAVREIDENKHRLKDSGSSNTFYGRDVYGYTAAKLAAGKITFEDVGPLITTPIIKIPYQKPVIENGILRGTVVILDSQYGNIWTNINKQLLDEYGLESDRCYKVRIFYKNQNKFIGLLLYHKTFGEAPKGEDLLYINSLLHLAIGTNLGNFAATHHISSGPNWHITVEKLKQPRDPCNVEWIYKR